MAVQIDAQMWKAMPCWIVALGLLTAMTPRVADACKPGDVQGSFGFQGDSIVFISEALTPSNYGSAHLRRANLPYDPANVETLRDVTDVVTVDIFAVWPAADATAFVVNQGGNLQELGIDGQLLDFAPRYNASWRVASDSTGTVFGFGSTFIQSPSSRLYRSDSRGDWELITQIATGCVAFDILFDANDVLRGVCDNRPFALASDSLVFDTPLSVSAPLAAHAVPGSSAEPTFVVALPGITASSVRLERWRLAGGVWVLDDLGVHAGGLEHLVATAEDVWLVSSVSQRLRFLRVSDATGTVVSEVIGTSIEARNGYDVESVRAYNDGSTTVLAAHVVDHLWVLQEDAGGWSELQLAQIGEHGTGCRIGPPRVKGNAFAVGWILLVAAVLIRLRRDV